MDKWISTDWSEGTKGLDLLVANSVRRHSLWVAIAGFGTISCLAALAVLLCGHDSEPPWLPVMFLVQTGLYVLCGWNVALRFPSVKDSRNRAGLSVDLPGCAGQFPVSVRYAWRGQDLGADRGIVVFEGGSLVFQGVRSRFAFGNNVGLKATRSQFGPSTGILSFKVKDIGYRVSLRPDADSRTSFFDEFEAWQLQRHGSNDDAVTPPIRPHREFLTRASSIRVGFAVMGCWSAGLMALATIAQLIQGHGSWLMIAAIVYLEAVVCCVASASVWRHKRSFLALFAGDVVYVKGCGGATLANEAKAAYEGPSSDAECFAERREEPDLLRQNG